MCCFRTFHRKNQKLQNVLGGEGGPAQSFLNIDSGQVTGAGEMCIGESCVSYSGDVLYSNGGFTYYNLNYIDKPC